MHTQNTVGRYGPLMVWLHWGMFILIAGAFTTIELRELFAKGSDPREALKTVHFMLGLCVLLFMIVRIYARLAIKPPHIEPPLPGWQMWSAITVHTTLYAWMIVMPVLGWLTLSAAGKPIPFFGLELPALIGADKELAKSLKEIHALIGETGYWLIGLHTAAALFHHYVAHDNTLVRILPKCRL